MKSFIYGSLFFGGIGCFELYRYNEFNKPMLSYTIENNKFNKIDYFNKSLNESFSYFQTLDINTNITILNLKYKNYTLETKNKINGGISAINNIKLLMESIEESAEGPFFFNQNMYKFKNDPFEIKYNKEQKIKLNINQFLKLINNKLKANKYQNISEIKIDYYDDFNKTELYYEIDKKDYDNAFKKVIKKINDFKKIDFSIIKINETNNYYRICKGPFGRNNSCNECLTFYKNENKIVIKFSVCDIDSFTIINFNNF